MTYRVPSPPPPVEVIGEDEAEVWRGILCGQVVLHSETCDEVDCSCHPQWVEAPGEA